MIPTAAATTNARTPPMAAPTEEESLVIQESSSTSNGNQRRGYLGALAPLVAALIVLTVATLSMNRPEEISAWASDTFHYEWIMHRRLYHPHNAAAYFSCTRMLSTSDTNYDNSLTMDEFKGFTNMYADDRYGATVGQNLPKDLREIFNKYASETEGRSNSIIDIYGSRNGERDGISKHQEDLLESLCNATSNTLDKMFEKEHKDLGVTATDVSTVAETHSATHHAPKKLSVNASFAMKLPPNMTIEDLMKTLKTGEDPGHLKHAFSSFVGGVVQHLNQGDKAADDGLDNVVSGGNATGGNETGDDERRLNNRGGVRGSDLIPFDAEEEAPAGHHNHWRRLDGVQMEPDSVEIYDYVESPCPGTEENGNKSETKCVTALGKYKIDVDEDEEKKEGGLQSVYQHAQKATKEAIDSGEMEKELQKETDGNMFHVEGHGMVEDASFDPYAEVEEEQKESKESMQSMLTLDIILISVGCVFVCCLCCVLCFVELEQKTRPRSNGHRRV